MCRAAHIFPRPINGALSRALLHKSSERRSPSARYYRYFDLSPLSRKRRVETLLRDYFFRRSLVYIEERLREHEVIPTVFLSLACFYDATYRRRIFSRAAYFARLKFLIWVNCPAAAMGRERYTLFFSQIGLFARTKRVSFRSFITGKPIDRLLLLLEPSSLLRLGISGSIE